MDKDTRGILEVRPGIELQDYSGPFIADLRLIDFSREQLARMLMMATEWIFQYEIEWTAYVTEKLGMEGAEEAHRYIYQNPGRFCRAIVDQVREWVNIKGNDIESFMKHVQVDPGTGPGKCLDVEFEMPSKDCGILTYWRCMVGQNLEESQPELLKKICEGMCPPSFEVTTAHYSPDIKVEPLIMPHLRKSKDDPYCKWRLTYKSKESK